jgi:hypothetical protein
LYRASGFDGSSLAFVVVITLEYGQSNALMVQDRAGQHVQHCLVSGMVKIFLRDGLNFFSDL